MPVQHNSNAAEHGRIGSGPPVKAQDVDCVVFPWNCVIARRSGLGQMLSLNSA